MSTSPATETEPSTQAQAAALLALAAFDRARTLADRALETAPGNQDLEAMRTAASDGLAAACLFLPCSLDAPHVWAVKP